MLKRYLLVLFITLSFALCGVFAGLNGFEQTILDREAFVYRTLWLLVTCWFVYSVGPSVDEEDGVYGVSCALIIGGGPLILLTCFPSSVSLAWATVVSLSVITILIFFIEDIVNFEDNFLDLALPLGQMMLTIFAILSATSYLGTWAITPFPKLHLTFVESQWYLDLRFLLGISVLFFFLSGEQ